MPTRFKYLVRQGGGSAQARSPDEAVEARYSIKDLATRPVVRDELQNNFLVFESRGEYLGWYAGVPEAERCYHEVIFGRLPQKIHFDIDAPAHKLDALPEATLAAALRAAGALTGDDCPGSEDLEAYLGELLGSSGEGSASSGEDPLEALLRDAPAAAAPAGAGAARPPVGAEAARTAKIHAVVGLLIEAILDELYVGYFGIEDIHPTREDLAVTDSSGATATGWKYSYHVIVLPYAVADNEEAREFTARVLERLPPPIRAFIDPDVNKRIQNFRLAGSAKAGTRRYKRATPEAAQAFGTAPAATLEDLFVTAPRGARVLQRAYTEAGAERPGGRPQDQRPALSPQSAVVKAALALAAREGITAGHHLSEVRGTLLCFQRDEPGAPLYCRVCGETHSKDSFLMVGIGPAEHEGPWPGTGSVACRVVEHCRQARGKGALIGELTAQAEDLRGAEAACRRGREGKPGKAGPPPASLQEQIAARVSAILEGRVNPHDALASEFERLPDAQKTVYAEGAMRDYELVPTLAVAAQMKLGKTKAMRRYLDAHFPADGFEVKVVRIVTFRQTFSRSLAEAFPDFALYCDAQGDLDHVRYPRLIVQVESLHRLKMASRPEPVDLLVLDEVESIFAQFNSGLHRQFNAAFAMFQWMLRTARHVVCMDANLGDRTYRALLRMRPAFPPHFHWNQFAKAADDSYHFTADQGAWLERLYSAIRAGQRVVLPTNSLSEGKAYEEAIRREFPARSTLLYSSETSPSEKVRHFGDVHTYWKSLDVLIYTPTCSAGVSFELEHFDVLFGFFCDISCDVETCRQMLGRVRNLRTREHYICLRATGAALPTAVEDIRRLIYDKRAGLYRRVEDMALQYEYDDAGEVHYYESDYFYLWLETTRVDNLSRNEFACRFIDQVADTGARVGVLAGEPSEGGLLLLADHRETRSELKAARCEAVAAAADLAPEEAAQVRGLLQAQQDVEPAARLAYEKYQLREAYSWHGRPLDAAFVADYQSPGARRVYRSLCRISEGPTVLDSLKAMHQREAGHYSYVMETRVAATSHVSESRDLLRDKTTYTFQAHFLAIWLLRVCCYACVTDRRRVSEAALEASLRAAIPSMRRMVGRLVYEFEIPKPGLDRLAREADRGRFLAGMLRTINAVLRAQYGLEVKRLAKRAGGGAYYLNQCAVGRLFVFSPLPEDDGMPGGPRPHIPSRLRPLSAANHRVDLFLEEAFYARDADPWADLGGDAGPTPNPSAGATEEPERSRPPGQDCSLDDFLTEEFERISGAQ